ncbi:hypothetical protein TWF718_010469 [Orbilia javanica]|uniref:Uncharacterized protein n=1 Tax=Orbilia javanica TaxID=47235 RepID=A0AAN8MI43_9PEZI
MEPPKSPKATTPPVVIGPSSMQLMRTGTATAKGCNERGSMSKRSFLRSKCSSGNAGFIGFKKTHKNKDCPPGLGRDLVFRDDHIIYHNEFYTGHIRSINNISQRISRIDNWIEATQGLRSQSRDALETINKDIMKSINDPTPANISNYVKGWEVQVRTIEFEYQGNRLEDSVKYCEGKSIRVTISAAKRVQENMMGSVIENMPKLFWKSSSPLRRMLELGKQISHIESHHSHMMSRLKKIISTDQQIKELLAECHRDLIRIINIMLQKIEGPDSEQTTGVPQVDGVGALGNSSMQEPLTILSEEALNKTTTPPQSKD